MCGIFGVVTEHHESLSSRYLAVFRRMGIDSQRRGKDSSGVVVCKQNSIEIVKSPERIKKLLSAKKTRNILKEASQVKFYIGHTRMQTHGNFMEMHNNHPVIEGDWLLFHNGIVVNYVDLGFKLGVPTSLQSDTVCMAKCLNLMDSRDLSETTSHLRELFNEAIGANTFVAINRAIGACFFWTSNGSMYLKRNSDGVILFASEKQTIRKALGSGSTRSRIDDIEQLPKRELLVLRIKGIDQVSQKFNSRIVENSEPSSSLMNYHEVYRQRGKGPSLPEASTDSSLKKSERIILEIFEVLNQRRQCKTCANCLLPENYPGIVILEDGVCGQCLRHKSKEVNGIDELTARILEKSKNYKNKPEVLVPVSGGRDSAFVLHYLTKVLGIKTVAYTYDWGFVTDTARENISRICGSLSVEHILISADIQKKRLNVRKNLNAWIKNPHLGMVPLFMAGDKAFFYHSSKLVASNDFGPAIWGMNRLEVAHFKSFQSGAAKPETAKNAKNTYDLTYGDKFRIIKFNFGESLKNPNYLNSSLLDTAFGFFAYYFKPVDYLQFFDFYKWNENEVYELLTREYGLQLKNSANLGWRMGDATAPFYNFVYNTYLGYNENNTLVANLIRDNQLTQARAKERLAELEYPDIEGILNYFKIVGVSPIEFLSQLRTAQVRTRH